MSLYKSTVMSSGGDAEVLGETAVESCDLRSSPRSVTFCPNSPDHLCEFLDPLPLMNMCMRLCVCVRACMSVYVHVFVLLCVHVCACVRMHLCVYMCACMYVCACIHMCVCACTCLYVCDSEYNLDSFFSTIYLHVCLCRALFGDRVSHQGSQTSWQ